jgi:methyl-accepting chemotaxis protein
LRANSRVHNANSAGEKLVFMIGRTNSTANELEAKVAAINRFQGVIEFNLDGTVITANENFLAVVGYTLAEVVGKHHSIFVNPNYAKSNDYRLFWDRLNRGEFVADKFRRISRSGKEIWLRASYNPLLDGNGKPFKVVKFAADITAVESQTRELEAKIAAIGRSQGVIEFNIDGTVITANPELSSCRRLYRNRGRRQAPQHVRWCELRKEC